MGKALAAALLSVACEDRLVENDVPDIPSDENLAIVSDSTVYSISGGSVTFTVRNLTADTLLVTMRDAFCSNCEHLFVTQGSSASVQKNIGASWVDVELPILIEGVAEIGLHPTKIYDGSWANWRNESGLFRLLIRYTFKDGRSGIAASNTFEIRDQ